MTILIALLTHILTTVKLSLPSPYLLYLVSTDDFCLGKYAVRRGKKAYSWEGIFKETVGIINWNHYLKPVILSDL